MNYIFKKYLIYNGYRLNQLAQSVSSDTLALFQAANGYPSLDQETLNKLIVIINPSLEDIPNFHRLINRDYRGQSEHS